MALEVKEITVAHSPDSDDAFMFYALAGKKIDTRGLVVNQVYKDIQTLNQEALEGRYEVSAVSMAAYPYIKDQYMLMPCGASMGDKYGPVLIAREPMTVDELKKVTVAIPGKLTSAYLTLQLFQPGLTVAELPFDQIIDAVKDGTYDAGLLIHEGQLTYAEEGLHKVVDLGVWWHDVTGLPLPLGGNVIKRELGTETMRSVTALLKEAIEYALANRPEALEYALTFSRDLPDDLADRFVGMYVNEVTVDCGQRGRDAVAKMFEMANERGLFKEKIVPEFVSLDEVAV